MKIRFRWEKNPLGEGKMTFKEENISRAQNQWNLRLKILRDDS